jgi:L-lactate dehydrogenase complex protein LldE
MVKVLEHLGCTVNYNTNQTCCGQPAFNAGFKLEATNVARKFIHDFSGNDYIVAPSGSCVGFIRNYYTKLFDNSSDHLLCQKVTGHIYEFTEFITQILKVEHIGSEFNALATYHDACGALRECGIKNGPRRLLEQVKGLSLEEMKESETCCGFGGTFAIKYEPISIGMAQSKVKNAMNTHAEYIISTDVSCLMHLQGYINANHQKIKTIHIADVLASGL